MNRTNARIAAGALGLLSVLLGAHAATADDAPKPEAARPETAKPEAPSLESRVRALLAETDPERRKTRLTEIVAAKPDAAAVASALAEGWTRPADAPKGDVDWTRDVPGRRSSTVFAHVPESYEAAKAWPVLIWLHGGVSHAGDGGGSSGIGFLSDASDRKGFLLLSPSSFEGAEWWAPAGVGLVRGALDDLARRYRVDPDRVFVAGHSDGGSACFHLLAHDPDPYAAFVAIMPNPLVTQLLGGSLHAANLSSRPIWAVNGGADRLYPAAEIEPHVENLRSAGLRIDWRALPDVGHDRTPFLDRGEEIHAFLAANPRPIPPPVVDFETSAPDRENRREWVRILEAKADAPSAEGFDTTLVPLEVPPAPPRIGITIDEEYEGTGLRVKEVAPGSPAATAGFRDGDVLVQAGDRDVSGPPGLLVLRGYLRTLAGGEGVFRVKRGDEEVVLRATPAVEPVEAPPAEGPSARIEARVLPDEGGSRRIEVRTLRVGAFRLDLAPPIWRPGDRLTVVVNGAVRYDGVPEPDVAAMLADALSEGPLGRVALARVTLRP